MQNLIEVEMFPNDRVKSGVLRWLLSPVLHKVCYGYLGL